MDKYELVEYSGLDRPEYILKNGKALNIYGAKKIIEQQQEEIALQNAQLLDAENEITELKAMVNKLSESLAGITSEENIHPIKDWAICGICANSSSGSEGRETRMKKFYKFFDLIDHANKLREQK